MASQRLIKLLIAAMLVISAVCTVEADDKPVFLNKSYKLLRTEDFQKLLTILDVSFLFTQFAIFTRPVITVTYNETTEYYTMKTETFVKDFVITFKNGVEFEHEAEDGRHVNSTITIYPTRMYHYSKGQNGQKDYKVISDYEGDKMTSLTLVGDFICMRYYYLVEE